MTEEKIKQENLEKSLEQFEKENPAINNQAITDFSVGFSHGWRRCREEFEKVGKEPFNQIIESVKQQERWKILNIIREVLFDYGLTIIESDRILDDKESFRLAIEDIDEKAKKDGFSEGFVEAKSSITGIIKQKIDENIKKITKELELQFDCKNLKITDKDDLWNDIFWSQYVIEAELSNTKKLEILNWIIGYEELQQLLDECSLPTEKSNALGKKLPCGEGENSNSEIDKENSLDELHTT